MMKLSLTQQSVVEKMESGQWYTSYDLDCSLSTMQALGRKGIVESGSGGLGSLWSPRTTYRWRLKEIK